MTITKGHIYVIYLGKLSHNNPKQILVNVNVYAKLGLIPTVRSQDTE